MTRAHHIAALLAAAVLSAAPAAAQLPSSLSRADDVRRRAGAHARQPRHAAGRRQGAHAAGRGAQGGPLALLADGRHRRAVHAPRRSRSTSTSTRSATSSSPSTRRCPPSKVPPFVEHVQDESFWRANIKATWPVYTGGKVPAANRAAEARVTDAEQQRKQTEEALAAELVRRYYGLRLAISARDVRTEVLDALDKHLHDATRLEEEGLISQGREAARRRGARRRRPAAASAPSRTSRSRGRASRTSCPCPRSATPPRRSSCGAVGRVRSTSSSRPPSRRSRRSAASRRRTSWPSRP